MFGEVPLSNGPPDVIPIGSDPIGTSQLRSKTWHRVAMDASDEGRAAKMDA